MRLRRPHPQDAQRTVNEVNEQRLVMLNDELSARLVRQTQASDRTDTKVTVIVGFALAIGQFLATRTLFIGLAIPAVIFLAASVGAGVWCLKPRPFIDVPEAQPFVDKYKRLDRQATLGGLIGSRVDAFNKNESQRLTKLTWWRYSLLALVLGAAMSAVSIWLGGR